MAFPLHILSAIFAQVGVFWRDFGVRTTLPGHNDHMTIEQIPGLRSGMTAAPSGAPEALLPADVRLAC
jgi:hypothetical protein